jgi:hypothetical protein
VGTVAPVLGQGDVQTRRHRPGRTTFVRRQHNAPSPHGQGARRGQMDGLPRRTPRLKHPVAGPNTTARPKPHLSMSSFPIPLHQRLSSFLACEMVAVALPCHRIRRRGSTVHRYHHCFAATIEVEIEMSAAGIATANMTSRRPYKRPVWTALGGVDLDKCPSYPCHFVYVQQVTPAAWSSVQARCVAASPSTQRNSVVLALV